MAEPTHEGPSPYHGGLTTHCGRREDCTSPDCGPVEPETLADILRGAADRIDAEDLPQTAEDTADFHDGARWATTQLRAVAGEVDTGPVGDATPDWLVELARRFASAALTGPERAILRYALDLVDDRIASEGDEFTDEDQDAVASLRSLATGPVVAYRNPYRPGVLLCREHGEGWAGLTPLSSDDLPDGGVCTHGDPADPSDVCGRDVLTSWPKEQPTETHSCANCEGVDPDTCLMNPNRPPEQCPRSEFDGYGLQCQKPAGHNLCTFEEQPIFERPAVGERPDTQTPEADRG